MILKEFITEEATKNKHLEHVEEEILNRGREGADYAIGVMMNFADMLKGRSNKKLKVSVKLKTVPLVFSYGIVTFTFLAFSGCNVNVSGSLVL